MFKSIISYDENENDYILFTITDDDFEEDILANCKVKGYRYRGARLQAIIQCYEKRELNVATSLSLFFKNCFPKVSIYDNCFILKMSLPLEYEKYINDINKYLLLM
jgi:hypothetical protein